MATQIKGEVSILKKMTRLASILFGLSLTLSACTSSGGNIPSNGGTTENSASRSDQYSYLPLKPLSEGALQQAKVYQTGQISELIGNVGEDSVREFSITAAPQPVELATGIVIQGWAYNGQIPGPLLRAKEGERVRITFRNEISGIGTALHWHGVLVPNDMDGVPPVTQPLVREGENFVYEFIAKPAGTFWYHAHSMGDNAQQLDQGLLAPLVIEAEEPNWEPEAAQEWVAVLDEWQVEGAGKAPPANDGATMRGMRSALLGTAEGYNLFTINGRAYLDEPFRVKAGEWARLRLLNGGYQQHRIHIHGLKAWVTRTDGQLLPTAQAAGELVISPYERLDVFVYGAAPGEYLLHDHDAGHSEAGMQAKIVVEQSADQTVKAIEDLPTRKAPGNAPLYQGLTAGIPGPDSTKYDRTFSLTLGMSMRTGQWAINGVSGPDRKPLPIRTGEQVRMEIINMSSESHPMHLHGHEFKVVAINGNTLSEPWLVKDTLNLRPMESMTISFTANNSSGDWLFHCHQVRHADDGLWTSLRYID